MFCNKWKPNFFRICQPNKNRLSVSEQNARIGAKLTTTWADAYSIVFDGVQASCLKWMELYTAQLQLAEKKIFGRMRHLGVRFLPWITKTHNHLLAFGRKDLAHHVADSWMRVLEECTFERFNVDLLFTKKNFNSSSFNDGEGGFGCPGAEEVGCVWRHYVQPRRSIQDFEELKVMQLDHLISVQLIGYALFTVAAQQLKTINWEMIKTLLFGRSNLRLVHCACHQTSDRKTDMDMLTALITA